MVRIGAVLTGVVVSSFLLQAGKGRVGDGALYAADGRLKYPAQYREWVFLSSGMDMSYTTAKEDMGAGMFNNVFVNPGAYRGYQATGHWPEGTVLVLENRGAALGSAHDAFLKAGKVQTTERMGMEVHVLDSSHAGGDGWAFYGFGDDGLGKVIRGPRVAIRAMRLMRRWIRRLCRFYPTLEAAAKEHKTFSSGYLKEMGKR